jgi:hypothetical protein
MLAAVKILEVLREIDFAPEYLILPQKMKNELEKRSKITRFCISVFTILSRYPLCAQKFPVLTK